MSTHFYKVKTRYFKEVKARKDRLLTCGHLILAGEIYWRSSAITMCKTCKEKKVQEEKDTFRSWWNEFWTYARDNLSEFVDEDGYALKLEREFQEQRKQHQPKVIFLRKRVAINEANRSEMPSLRREHSQFSSS